jgi:flagellar basal body-associated protein FliL
VFLCMVILLVILVIATLVYGVVAFVYGSSTCKNEINLMLKPST